MNNAVLISIKSKWCELIDSGKKTVEIRRTRPKIEVPFKCYIYCTKGEDILYHGRLMNQLESDTYNLSKGTLKLFGDYKSGIMNGKVIGEFTCSDIEFLGNISTDKWDLLKGDVHEYHKKLVTEQACLTEEELLSYRGKYAWHIDNLVIYDKPKELNELGVSRPPQSWQYIK